MTNRTNIKAKAISVAGGFTLLQDVAQPIAPFAAYVAGVSAISTLILLLVHLFYKAGENLKTAWLLSAATFVLSTGLWGFQQYFDASESGLLASSTPVVADFQQAIGIAKSIQADTHAIRESTHSIDKKMDKVKQETSQDPKKELANRGIAWSESAFREALVKGDMETISLFLDGGFKVNLYGGTNQNFFLSLVHDATAANFDKVVKFLISRAVIIPNKGLRIYVMGSFENPMSDIPYPKVNARYSNYRKKVMQEDLDIYQKKTTAYSENQRKQLEESLKTGKKYTAPTLPKYNNRATAFMYVSLINLLTIAVWDNNESKVKTLLEVGEEPTFSGRVEIGIDNSPDITPVTEANLFANKRIRALLRM